MNAGGVLNTCKSNEKIPACRYEYSGARVSNAWIICLWNWDNIAKAVLIPDKIVIFADITMKDCLSLEAVV